MLNRWLNYLFISSAIITGAIIVLMTLSVNYEVVMRYFFGQATAWITDYAEFALVYVTILAAGWVLAREGHVKIELIVSALSPRAQQVLNTITSALGVLVCGVFFWYSLQVTLDAFRLNQVFIHATATPQWPIWMVLPIGSSLLTIQFLRRTWRYARGSKVSESSG